MRILGDSVTNQYIWHMPDFRIHQVIINHIGAFKHLNLELKKKVDNSKAEIHILTGENGTGKSTILEVLSSFQNPNLLTAKVHLDHLNKVNFEVRTSSIQDYKDSPTGKITAFESFISKFDSGRWSDGFNRSDVIFQYFNKCHNYEFQTFDFALFAYSGYRSRELQQSNINYISEIAENPLTNSLDLRNSINSQIILQWIANTKTKEALAFTKNDLEKSKSYKNTIDRIQQVICEITDLKIVFNLGDNPLKVIINVDGLDLDFSTLPDGLKSIISWITDLLMRMERLKWKTNEDIFDRNFVLFLDEIEIHLHPAWQRKVLPIIQKLFVNAQIIISTHSPFVTNSVDGAWIYKLKKEGHYSVLDGEPILSENGKSYTTILDEIFGISEQFGEEVENDLKLFYKLKSSILANTKNGNLNEFQRLADSLRKQSLELESIIGMELRQMRKSGIELF